ncbi:MAG TPA: NADH-quinone oxidoreductase subunit L [Burkholderiaceae bacterium]
MTNSPMQVLLWCLPPLYVAAILPAFFTRQEKAWRIAEGAAAAAIALPCAALAFAMANHPGNGARFDRIGVTMALLITLLGWIILRYSRRYLHGEDGQRRYMVAMTLTLASVSTVTIADHLAIVAGAWATSSLCLHHLLTFYRDRRPAQIVAHKKFLASRLADLSMALALALIYRGAGTLSLAELARRLSTPAILPGALHLALALVALAVILKSAQLPVHGWLIQVMEAPTPVSALLHAGIVNIGGFILIRLAVPLSAAPIAQTMLLVIGGLTALLASLVTMTRISIKVRLAWSTCAQMGFMLLECGLGLYDLAFLHLLAHSLYKAHAFLVAGEAVHDTRRAKMLPVPVTSSAAIQALGKLAAAPMAAAIVLLALWPWRWLSPTAGLPPSVLLIVSMGLAPLLWREEGRHSGLVPFLWRGPASVFILAQMYIAWHLVFGALVSLPETQHPGFAMSSTAWVCVCFLVLYLAQVWLSTRPRNVLATTLFDWAYHGFYLDERFTRLTFNLWPVRFPHSTRASVTTSCTTGEPA